MTDAITRQAAAIIAAGRMAASRSAYEPIDQAFERYYLKIMAVTSE